MEDLQKLWQGQGIPQSFRDQNSFEILQKGLKEQQKKVRRTNWIATLCFMATLLVYAGIYYAFPNQSIFFYVGMLIISLDMIIFSILMWLGIATQKFDASQNQKDFAQKAIHKLKFQLFLNQATIWVYGVMLMLGLSIYYLDFVSVFTYWQIVLIYGGTYAYFILVSLFVKKHIKRKGNLVKVQLSSWEELMSSEEK